MAQANIQANTQAQDHLTSSRPFGHVITAPLSARAHFEQPSSKADLGGAQVHYIDPTDPGHDFLESTQKPAGALRALAGRVRRVFSL